MGLPVHPLRLASAEICGSGCSWGLVAYGERLVQIAWQVFANINENSNNRILFLIEH